MKGYFSADNGGVRFRTADYSIDVKLPLRVHIAKILKVKDFYKGVITADIMYRRKDETDENLRVIEDYFDIGYELKLLGIPKKLLKKVTKVKAERAAVEMNGFLFRGFHRCGHCYIEVVNASDNRQRCVYLALDDEGPEMSSSTMPDNMHSKYADDLKAYYDMIKKDMEAFGYKAV